MKISKYEPEYIDKYELLNELSSLPCAIDGMIYDVIYDMKSITPEKDYFLTQPQKLIHKLDKFTVQGYNIYDDCIYCPNCNAFRGNCSFGEIRKYPHCPDCGQKLDWSP